MRHNFQQELLAEQTMSNQVAIKDITGMIVLQYLVLVEACVETLTLTDQKLRSIHHLLIGQKVQLAVCLP